MQEINRVRLINDPTRVGVLTGRELLRRNRKLLQVQFSDGIRWVPEKQIEVVGDLRLSPLDMLESEKLGRPSDLRRTLTHVKLSGRLADVIYSMEATNTDFYAYQFKPVVKILESPSNGILIADEVGLGKTIEAGLIWTELRSRFDMRRLMIICPAALREKWKRELSTKIGVSAQICNANEVLETVQSSSNQDKGFALIAGLQSLRPPLGWEHHSHKRASAQLARFLRSMENEERLVDLLVIDEAHHLRNPETQTNELGELFKAVSDYTVLLTATPLHNRNEDLFSLLQVLDPDTFTRTDVFSQILYANQPLVKARDLILGHNPDVDIIRDLLQSAKSHQILKSNRQLTMIEENDLVPEKFQNRNHRSRLAYKLETVNLLAHTVTRTRKSDVKEWRVVREPVPEFVDLNPVEEKFYELVTDVVVEYARKLEANERFLLAQPQRQMTSSMAASLRLWQRRLLELEELELSGESEDDNAKKRKIGPLVTEIVLRSRDYVELSELIKSDTKYKRLKKNLIFYLRDYPDEKVVLFSAFHATLDYLAERFEKDGITYILLKGGQRETKDDTIKHFSDPDGPSVLLSSEVGGEGVDLQFSRLVINYDLPWNPMRLEQRIGRVDRLGQKAEKVLIWNIFYANTIDSRIYERLYDKLDLCRKALGDFDSILGDAIRQLEIDLLSGDLTPKQQEMRIDQTAQALENKKLTEQNLELDAANLIAYGDYILNQVNAAREFNRWISGNDIHRYITDYMRLNYPGCDFRQIEVDSLVYDIELSDTAKYDLSEYIREHRLPMNTMLTLATRRSVRCRFENRVVGSDLSGKEEVISQFHPLVRMVSHKIANSDEQITPAVALSLARTNLNIPIKPGIYLIAVSLWSFYGLQDTEKLAYAAVSINNVNKFLSTDIAERLAQAAVVEGEDWLEAGNKVDLNQIYEIANDILYGNLDYEFEKMDEEIRARNHDRADIQSETLDQHLYKQMTKLEEILQKHIDMGRDPLVKATKGRIRALEKRVEQQRLGIEKRREVRSESQEIAIAILNIV